MILDRFYQQTAQSQTFFLTNKNVYCKFLCWCFSLYLHLFAPYTCHFSVFHPEKFLNVLPVPFLLLNGFWLSLIYGCCLSTESPIVLRSCYTRIYRFILLFSMLLASLFSNLIILLAFYMAVNGSAFWVPYYVYIFYSHQIIISVLQFIY